MPSPARTNEGHRVYGRGAFKAALFYRARPGARVPQWTPLSSLGETPCRSKSGILVGHFQGIEQNIFNLQAFEVTLKNLLEACTERVNPACPIIETLYKNSFSLVTLLERK
jgi:hypothetical protein